MRPAAKHCEFFSFGTERLQPGEPTLGPDVGDPVLHEGTGDGQAETCLRRPARGPPTRLALDPFVAPVACRAHLTAPPVCPLGVLFFCRTQPTLVDNLHRLVAAALRTAAPGHPP